MKAFDKLKREIFSCPKDAEKHLKKIIQRPSQLALAWVIAQGGDIIPIPGTRRVRYLEENVQALSIKLTAEDLAHLDAIASKGSAAGTRFR
jgi:aryl-alcohol dehydrogenase-like predicted oxidoreductase